MRPTSQWQRGLQHFNGVLFQPNSSTAGGNGLGGVWTTDTASAGITISHATPGTAFDTQMKRTVYTNVITTQNQELGPRLAAAGDKQFWVGNADNLGGFYFSAIFRIETWSGAGSGTDGRLFVGLSGNATSCALVDVVPHNSIGLSHVATDGQDVLNLVVVDNSGSITTKNLTVHSGAVSPTVNAPGILASGVMLLWEIWAFPFAQSTVVTNCRLSYFDPTNKYVSKVVWSSSGGLTTNQFMAPQVQMSNGATDTTAAHYSIGVANVYCVPWTGETS